MKRRNEKRAGLFLITLKIHAFGHHRDKIIMACDPCDPCDRDGALGPLYLTLVGHRQATRKFIGYQLSVVSCQLSAISIKT